jgi:hypothetical protein
MKARLEYSLLAFVAFGMAGMVGCGKSDSPAPAQAPGTPAPAQAPKTGNNANKTPRPTGDGADVAVYDFMEAVRIGDDETAGKLLTPLARQKVAEHHMVVAPPGTDTARFVVGQVERVEDGLAKVAVNWSDTDESGKPRTDQIVWLAKRVDEGWRISGVAAPVFDNEPPILLNFEDPAEMLRKQQAVREEMRRRAQQQAGAGAAAPAPQQGTAPAAAAEPSPEARQAARPANEPRR